MSAVSAASQSRLWTLQRITTQQQKELEKGDAIAGGSGRGEGVEILSRLIRSLSGHLGLTKKSWPSDGVTVGAVHLWGKRTVQAKREEEGRDSGPSKLRPGVSQETR